MFPKSWTEQGLTCEHVPLLFYAPKLLQPKRINEVCSQADILPTVASLVKTNYRNTTFGRNLFDTVSALQYKSILPKENFSLVALAMIIVPSMPAIWVFLKHFLLSKK